MLGAFAVPIAIQSTGLVNIVAIPGFGISAQLGAQVADRPVARHIPLCSGGNRAERRLTCIVDGDTGWENGVKWRLTSRSGGVDAPEISKPECQAERTAGERATRRLQTLMGGDYELVVEGSDRYGRQLVVVELADGRDAGAVLIDEGGLAQEWPNSRNPWCS